MTYRTAPFEPLILSLGQGLLALDPATGAIAWSVSLKRPTTRLYRVGERVLALGADVVTCVDRESGAIVGQVELGFHPDEAIVCGTDLVLAEGNRLSSERPAVVCLSSDGVIRWKATTTLVSTGLLSGDICFRSLAADGSVLTEARYGMMGAPAGFLYRDTAVQPDRR